MRFRQVGKVAIGLGVFGACVAGGPVTAVQTASASPVPLRGVIEGFYGTPWQQEERLDILAFCRAEGFNAYLYAPKDDPYHREKWREPYPEDKLRELGALVKAAKAQDVRFIFAVSPGLDVSLHGYKGYADRQKMLAKFETLYALGVRDFAIFFDDIKDKDGAGQAAFLSDVSRELRRRHADIGAFLTVPTEYFYADMQEGGARKPYTDAFTEGLSHDVLVLYTGDGVAKGPLTDEALAKADALYGRALGLWWNYPVNDYMETKLALGPVDPLPKGNLPAIFFNSMKVEALSKIALATGADYAEDPEHYDPEKSWQEAIKRQYGPLAKDMALFAAGSRHLENDWASIGLADDPDFAATAERLLESWPDGAGAKEAHAALLAMADARAKAAGRLLKELPPEQLKACRPQLEQTVRLASASRTALMLLQVQQAVAKDGGRHERSLRDKLQRELTAIDQHEAEAEVSEKAMGAFVRNVARRR